MVYKIMIVEDDDKIEAILADHLMKYSYEVVRAQDLHSVKGEFVRHKPDLVIMDINLPFFDGFYWCRQIRAVSSIPIVFLSARSSGMDQVMAIENGGDDYITKPFDLDVVTAKVKGVLRRAYGEYSAHSSPHRDVLDLDGLFLHQTRNEIEFAGRHQSLTKNEFRLLYHLGVHIDEVVSREDLLEALWDDVEFVDDNTLTVNVMRVRSKLAELGIEDAIETVRGQGYRLRPSWRGPQ